jgi:hypothetical protein
MAVTPSRVFSGFRSLGKIDTKRSSVQLGVVLKKDKNGQIFENVKRWLPFQLVSSGNFNLFL